MSKPQTPRRMAVTAAIVVAAVVGMTGLAFAAVPLYDMFCKVTGYGGTTQVATSAPTQMLERTIDVRFDSNIADGLPLEFTPVQARETVHLGETAVARYRVRNTSDHPITMIASYNVAPHKAGLYFQKLECFCFQDQTLEAGEEAELPVVYYVDPALATDIETEELTAVTLSYTFFRTADEAAAAVAQ